MSPAILRKTLAFSLPALLGGLLGDALLDGMNTVNPSVYAALARSASAPPRARIADPHVVVLLIDGVGERFFEEATRRGALRPVSWSQRVETGTPSLSRPSYHVLFTGVTQAMSGVCNNRFGGRARADTIMDRVRDAGGRVAWALESVDWMYGLAGTPGEPYLRGASALDVNSVAELSRGHALVMVHWTATDGAGHAHGARSPEYARAVREAFSRASALHDRLAATSGAGGFTLLVGADHGHSARGGHGGPEPDVTRVRWVRLGGAPSPSTGLQPATRMAATFADALGVPSPSQATGCSLWHDEAWGDCPTVNARGAVLRRAVAIARADAMSQSRLASLAYLVIACAAAWTLPTGRTRRERAGALAGSFAVLSGACAGFATLGPGWTLTAIRTHASFLARASCSQAVGVLLAWWAVKKLVRAREEDIAWASALVPLGAAAASLGSPGRSLAGDVSQLVAPTTGLFPFVVCAVLGAWSLVANALQRGRGTPAGGAPALAIRQHTAV